MQRSLLTPTAAAWALALSMAGAPEAHGAEAPPATPIAEAVTISGTIRVEELDVLGRPRVLAIESPVMGRYRISDRGLGTSLEAHVGAEATLAGPIQHDRDGSPVLVVERFRIHDS